MNLQQAIQVLTQATTDAPREADPDIYDAVKLGLEALIFIRGSREAHQVVTNISLPGESRNGDTPEDLTPL